jgi:putative endonuclease
MTNENAEWFVYIILCSDASLYTGISTDVARRFAEHQQQKGAKYFRSRSPKEIVYTESKHTRSTASQREITIKSLSRHAKLSLIDSSSNELLSN